MGFTPFSEPSLSKPGALHYAEVVYFFIHMQTIHPLRISAKGGAPRTLAALEPWARADAVATPLFGGPLQILPGPRWHRVTAYPLDGRCRGCLGGGWDGARLARLGQGIAKPRPSDGEHRHPSRTGQRRLVITPAPPVLSPTSLVSRPAVPGPARSLLFLLSNAFGLPCLAR